MSHIALSCAVKLGRSLMSLSRANLSMLRQSDTVDSRQLGPTSNSGTRPATVTISCELSIAAYTENGMVASSMSRNRLMTLASLDLIDRTPTASRFICGDDVSIEAQTRLVGPTA